VSAASVARQALTLGPALAKGHLLSPWLAVWAPNIILSGVGAALFLSEYAPRRTRSPLAFLIEVLQRCGEFVERRVVVEAAVHEAQAVLQVAPYLFPERRPRSGFDRILHDPGEVLVLPVAPGEADQ